MQVERAQSWVRASPLPVDATVAGGAGVVFAAAALSASVPLALFFLVEFGALAWRRDRPVPSAGVAFAAAFGVWLSIAGSAGNLTVSALPAGLGVLLAVYSLAARGPRWARWVGLAVGMLGAVLGAGTILFGTSLSYALSVTGAVQIAGAAGFMAVLVLLAWTAGQWRRTRLAYVDSLLDRARRAEREREQQAVIAAAAERARIARELHDVVAHSLSVIIAQADGGRYAAAASPQAATGALETVAATGRAALTDMRRLLGVLRDGDGEGAGLVPQPDAASVPDLVDTVRGSGLSVDLVTTGTPRQLPSGVGLAVYRTVQEALTNVLKHGGPDAHAQVRLDWTPAALEVSVHDDGRGAGAGDDGVGRGLAGMRERVALYGGSVRAGPSAGGGFAVHAVLPWRLERR